MPKHKHLRGLAKNVYGENDLGMCGRIQELTDELLDNLEGKGSSDSIDDLKYKN
ncbi:hypothetical protein [Planococcus koreensis]|uniref:hypothetical protein n=1 Tax=Planococcus koreensis TaxID=112331 RepID=UPI0039FCC15B